MSVYDFNIGHRCKNVLLRVLRIINIIIEDLMWVNKFVSMMCSACEPQVLISGVTDVIVVQDTRSQWLVCSPFFLCFGTDVTMEIGEAVRVTVNGQRVPFNFHLDDNGYIHPNTPTTEDLRKFDLLSGKNIVEYTIGTPGTVTYASLIN
jgi:phosphatidate phosphatase PAH1